MLEDTEGEVLAPDAEEIEQDVTETDAPEASEEEQADAQEGEQTEPGEESEPAYTVTIDGEERQLSRRDIEKGIMLHKAFTQKTQGLSEEKRQWDANVAKAREALSREVDTAKGWLEFYLTNQPQEPDWAAIAEKNPADWVREKAKWDAEAGKRAQAQRVYQEIRQQELAQQQEQFVASLYQQFPAWQDQAVMVREVGEIYSAAAEYGLTQDAVNQITDPKAFKILKDAAAWRKLQGKKTEVQARVTEAPKKPPVKAPSAPKSDGDGRAKFAKIKSPTIADAAKYLDF